MILSFSHADRFACRHFLDVGRRPPGSGDRGQVIILVVSEASFSQRFFQAPAPKEQLSEVQRMPARLAGTEEEPQAQVTL